MCNLCCFVAINALLLQNLFCRDLHKNFGKKLYVEKKWDDSQLFTPLCNNQNSQVILQTIHRKGSLCKTLVLLVKGPDIWRKHVW